MYVYSISVRTCSKPVDVVVLIDTSESMNSGTTSQQMHNWEHIKIFLKNIARILNVEASQSRLSVIKVSNCCSLLIHAFFHHNILTRFQAISASFLAYSLPDKPQVSFI